MTNANKSTVLAILSNNGGEVKATGIGSHLWDAMLELIEEKVIRVEFRNGGPGTLILA